MTAAVTPDAALRRSRSLCVCVARRRPLLLLPPASVVVVLLVAAFAACSSLGITPAITPQGNHGAATNYDRMETVTITQAATRTGMTAKAIARRIERGTLQAIVKDGKRRIPVAELDRLPRGTTKPATAGEGNHGATPVEIAPLIARLEALAGENMKLRLLQEQDSSTESELRAQVIRQAARIQELEAKSAKRRFFPRRAQAAVSV